MILGERSYIWRLGRGSPLTRLILLHQHHLLSLCKRASLQSVESDSLSEGTRRFVFSSVGLWSKKPPGATQNVYTPGLSNLDLTMCEDKKWKVISGKNSAVSVIGKKRETDLIRRIVGRCAIIHNRGDCALTADVNPTGGSMSNYTAYDCTIPNNVHTVNSNVNAIDTACECILPLSRYTTIGFHNRYQ